MFIPVSEVHVGLEASIACLKTLPPSSCVFAYLCMISHQAQRTFSSFFFFFQLHVNISAPWSWPQGKKKSTGSKPGSAASKAAKEAAEKEAKKKKKRDKKNFNQVRPTEERCSSCHPSLASRRQL